MRGVSGKVRPIRGQPEFCCKAKVSMQRTGTSLGTGTLAAIMLLDVVSKRGIKAGKGRCSHQAQMPGTVDSYPGTSTSSGGEQQILTRDVTVYDIIT